MADCGICPQCGQPLKGDGVQLRVDVLAEGHQQVPLQGLPRQLEQQQARLGLARSHGPH